jgi:hypothetical protein
MAPFRFWTRRPITGLRRRRLALACLQRVDTLLSSSATEPAPIVHEQIVTGDGWSTTGRASTSAVRGRSREALDGEVGAMRAATVTSSEPATLYALERDR